MSELNERVTRLVQKSQEQRQVRDLLYPPEQHRPAQRCQSLNDLRLPTLSSGEVIGQLVDEIFTMVLLDSPKQMSKKPPQCHQCHAPLSDEVHVGIASGVGRCSLEHWIGCVGGITGGTDKHGKLWASCPTEDLTDSESDSSSSDALDTTQADLKTQKDELPGTLSEAAAVLLSSLENVSSHISPLSQLKQAQDLDVSDCSDDEELQNQRAELARLQKEFRAEEVASQVAAKLARSAQRKQKRARELAELARQTQILKDKKAALFASNQHSTSRAADKSGNSSSVGRQIQPSSSSTSRRDLKDKVAEHEAKKARKAAAKLAEQQLGQGGDLTIGGIRALPGVRREVEEYIAKLRGLAPTLASDPTAGGIATGVLQHDGLESPERDNMVYVAELGRAIPIVARLSDLPGAAGGMIGAPRPVPLIVDSSDSESECSADEDCPLEPEPGTRFSWKKHTNGRKYFKPVPARSVSPEIKVIYKFDTATGCYEQVTEQLQQKCHKKSTTASVKTKATKKSSPMVSKVSKDVYKDHRIASSRGSKVPARRDERQPSFVSSDPDKQGRESKLPSLVQYARDCPVSWTSKVTTSGLNPLLFSWAYIAELLATRTGQSPSLHAGELEARLQHFLSVLEVTLQTTSQTDFASDSWKVARLYHQKVQDKVDSGVYSWLDLAEQWGTATLPHELMAANAELAPRTFKRGEKSPKGKKVEERKGPCGYWNNSETKGAKCKWELENGGQKCNRQHICSWCKVEHNQINYHQKTFCKKRQDKEAE